MADRYYGRLRQHLHEKKKSLSISGEADGRLEALVQAMTGQPMSVRDYQMLLVLVYDQYVRAEKSPASLRYIVLRMQQAERARRHKGLRVLFPLIVDYEVPIPQEAEAFLARKRPLLDQMRSRLVQAGIGLASVVYVVVLVLLALGLRWGYFGSLWLSLAVSLSLFGYWYWRAVPELCQQTISHMGRGLGGSFFAFEDAFAKGGLPAGKSRRG